MVERRSRLKSEALGIVDVAQVYSYMLQGFLLGGRHGIILCIKACGGHYYAVHAYFAGHFLGPAGRRSVIWNSPQIKRRACGDINLLGCLLTATGHLQDLRFEVQGLASSFETSWTT